jgi:NAD+ kinase
MDSAVKIAVVVHQRLDRAQEVARTLIEQARGAGFEVVADERAAPGLDLTAVDVDRSDADIVAAVGGDGTVLRAAQHALALDVPLFGVNLGRIGFLADVEPDEIESVVGSLKDGTWIEVERLAIEASIAGVGSLVGVNDVVVEKMMSQRLVSIEVAVDGEPFLTYHADGLVFSTPTGSTAYNLSAGGPLVHPNVESIILTPVAHHSLFSSAIVLPPTSILKCTVVREWPVGVNVDGHELGSAAQGEEIIIRRAPRKLRFIDHSRRSYPRLIKEKLKLE